MNNFEIKERIRFLKQEIYKFHGAGGGLHIVLDDGNMENDHINYCIEYVKECDSFTEEQKNMQIECAELLLKLGYSKRIKLYNERFR